jgi:IS30 family transposase
VWHSLPLDQKTKERRRPKVEALAKQGYTQEAIAMQLGVSQKTISNDFQTLVTATNVKGQGKDTLGRKKARVRKAARYGALTHGRCRAKWLRLFLIRQRKKSRRIQFHRCNTPR